jgi:hypothetical protein
MLKNSVNHTFFNNINTEEQAYLLGFYVADGCSNKYKDQSYRLKISVSEVDKEILQLYKRFIYPEANIIQQKSKHYKYQSKDMCSFIVSSNSIFESVNLLGYGRNKTYKNLNLPNISKELIPHFIRGYFDGDGAISFKMGERKVIKKKTDTHYFNSYCSFTSCTKTLLEDIQKFCKENYDISFVIRIHKKKYFSMDISSLKNMLLFYNMLYKDANFYLNRKKSKYDEFINLKINFTREHRVPNRIKKLLGM